MLRLLAGVVMISLSAVFVKLVTVSPTAAAFYRMFFGGLVLLVVVLWRRERLWFGWPALTGLTLAALFFALDLAFWHRSILYVGPGIATLLANFQVILLALAGVLLFGERAGWRFVLAMVCALGGLGLLVGGDWAKLSAGYKTGIALGLLTAVCYAAYILSLSRARTVTANMSPVASIAVLSLVCALLLAGFTGVQGESLVLPGWRDAGWLLVYGITAQVLGWALISKTLPHVPASKVGLILLLQPVCAFIWDSLFFARQFSTFEVTGGIITLIAIYLGTQRRQRVAA